MTFRRASSVVLAAAIIVTVAMGASADVTWKSSATSNSWGDATNWSSGTVPGAADTVDLYSAQVLATGLTNIVVNDTFSIGAVKFDGGTTTSKISTISGTGKLNLGVGGWDFKNGNTTTRQLTISVELGLANANTVFNTDGSGVGSSDQAGYGQTWYNISAPVTGVGGILKTGGGTFNGGNISTGYLQFKDSAAGDRFTFSGGATARAGIIRYDAGTLTGSVQRAFGGTVASPGTITLDGGVFEAMAIPPTGPGTWVLDVVNPLVVTSNNGGAITAQGNSSSTGKIQVKYSGSIDLGGQLYMGNGLARSFMNAAANPQYTGTITINNSQVGRPGLLTGPYDGPRDVDMRGNIVDGAGTLKNPLFLRPDDGSINILGTGNTYSAGTLIEGIGSLAVGNTSYVNVDATSTLGAGGATVMPGGHLRINAAANVAGAINVKSNGMAVGVLDINYAANSLPSTTFEPGSVLSLNVAPGADLYTALNTAVPAGVFISTSSKQPLAYTGKLADPGGTADAPKSYLLGGNMALRPDIYTVSYSATNAFTGANNGLQIGQNKLNGQGGVTLAAANDFGGTIDITGLTSPNVPLLGSYLFGTMQATGSPFGLASGDVKMHGSHLEVDAPNSGTMTIPAKNDLAFDGQNQIAAKKGTSVNAEIDFTSMTRSNRGILTLTGVSSATSGSTLGGSEKIKNAALSNSSILAPYYLVAQKNTLNANDINFATYDTTNGFGAFSGYTTVTTGFSGGDGTQVILTSTTTSNTDQINVSSPADIKGLKLTGAGNVYGSPITIENGGVLFQGSSLSYKYLTVKNDITFNSEAVIWCDTTVNNASGLFSGKISSAANVGLTRGGQGQIQITNVNNDFTGQITLNLGMTQFAFDKSDGTHGALGPVTNNILLNGGMLTRYNLANYNDLNSSRTIKLGSLGGYINSSANGRSTMGNIDSLITDNVANAAGPMIFAGNANFTITNANNDYTGGTWLLGAGATAAYIPAWVTVTTGKLGTGDVFLEPNTQLWLKGANTMSDTAGLEVALQGKAFLMYNGNTTVGQLRGNGDVTLGDTGGVATNLRVGNGNANSVFGGSILTAAGGTGNLTKVGTGSFTLNGPSSYNGLTTVTGGQLIVNGSIASSSGVSLGADTILSGRGIVPAISGSGLVSPGNSPGILTSTQVDPAGGLGFGFEITAGSPNYGDPSASLNDVLRLTGATPFTTALTAANHLDMYFATLPAANDVFKVGFYSDVLASEDLLAQIKDATLTAYVADPLGTVVFNGTHYSVSDITLKIDAATETANFGSGNVSGSISEVTVVPEPATLALLVLGGIGVLARRRR